MSAADKKVDGFRESACALCKKMVRPFLLSKDEAHDLTHHVGALGVAGAATMIVGTAYIVVPVTVAVGAGFLTHAFMKRATEMKGLRFFSGLAVFASAFFYLNAMAGGYYDADVKEQTKRMVPVAQKAVMTLDTWQKHTVVLASSEGKQVSARIDAVIHRTDEKGNKLQEAMLTVNWPSIGRVNRWKHKQEERITVTRPEGPRFAPAGGLSSAP